ncbi:hypothetical protein T265_09683 [Opisthorchis viverrini]|uniref:Uncharacterized protein n=1 Tax=Opisthorchis viverrini TaxID=6198 RepID=A0A074Z511_OPIVI|nr:hypothetical protein T265_09683 [Opisthorchis viverrini]KER22151.1 hypothetical protein T265_09683 [Opisthorchis viverrini]
MGTTIFKFTNVSCLLMQTESNSQKLEHTKPSKLDGVGHLEKTRSAFVGQTLAAVDITYAAIQCLKCHSFCLENMQANEFRTQLQCRISKEVCKSEYSPFAKLIRQLNVLHQAASCFSRYDIQLSENIKNERFSWVPATNFQLITTFMDQKVTRGDFEVNGSQSTLKNQAAPIRFAILQTKSFFVLAKYMVEHLNVPLRITACTTPKEPITMKKLLTSLLKTLPQSTTGFVLFGAHQVGPVPEFPSTLCFT